MTIRSLRLQAPFVLVGHSLGSLLSARFAAQYPEQVSRLVLVSPPVYIAPAEISDPRVRAQVDVYLRVYEFVRQNKNFTILRAGRIARFFALDAVHAQPAELHRVADDGKRHLSGARADRHAAPC